MGEQGGLGGGDCGLVIDSADCTAAGIVGAGRDSEVPDGVPEGIFCRKQKRWLAKSQRRDMDSSSRAQRSSWSLSKRATRRLLMLGGSHWGRMSQPGRQEDQCEGT